LEAQKAILKEDSLTYKIYGSKEISERHRHRYEVNNQFVPIFEKMDLRFQALHPQASLLNLWKLKIIHSLL